MCIRDRSKIESSTITINNGKYEFLAIASSGEYRNFIYDNSGNKITHTINPKTLTSINNDVLSVTVISETSATYADAFATAFNAMGVDNAMKVSNENNISTMIIYRDKNNVNTIYSDKWYDLFYE